MGSPGVLDDVAENNSQKDTTVSPSPSAKGSGEQKTLDQADETADTLGNGPQESVDRENEEALNVSDDGGQDHNLFGEDEDKSDTAFSPNAEGETIKEQDVDMGVERHDSEESEVVKEDVEMRVKQPAAQISDVTEQENGAYEHEMEPSTQSVSGAVKKEAVVDVQERIDDDVEMGGVKEETEDSTDKAGDLSNNQGVAGDAPGISQGDESGKSREANGDLSVEQLSDQIHEQSQSQSQAPLEHQKKEDQENKNDDGGNTAKEMMTDDSQEHEDKGLIKQSDRSSQNLAIPQSHEIVIPSYSKWFNLTKIHSIERQSLPEFFTNRIPSKTPQVYVKCRNYMVNSYRLNPNEYFSVTTARRNICGDSAAIFRVHKLLMKWGLINYQVDATMLPKNVEPPFTGEYSTKHDAPRGLFPFESYKPSVQLPDMAKLKKMMDTNDSNSTLHKYMKERKRKLDGETDTIEQTAEAANGLHQEAEVDNQVEQHNTSATGSTNSVKRPKVLQESNIDDGWGKEELQKLLKGIQEHGSEWYTIAKGVGTKSPEQCILKFLQLPIEDRFLHQNTKSSDLGPLKYAPHLPFSKSENPVMSTIAFLVGLVDPENVQKMTNRALRNEEEIKSEISDKVVADIEPPKQENFKDGNATIKEPTVEAIGETTDTLQNVAAIKEDDSSTVEPKDKGTEENSVTSEKSSTIIDSKTETEEEDAPSTEEPTDETKNGETATGEELQNESTSDDGTTSEEPKSEFINEDTPVVGESKNEPVNEDKLVEESKKEPANEETVSVRELGEPKNESIVEDTSTAEEPKKELRKEVTAAGGEPKKEAAEGDITTSEEPGKEAISEDTVKDGSEIALASLGVRSHVFATSEERQMNMISNQLVNVQLQKIETKLKLLGKIEESLELEKKSLQRQQEDVLVQRLALAKHSHLVYGKFEDSLRTLSNPGDEKDKLTNQVTELKELLYNPPKLSIGAAFSIPNINSSSNSSFEPSGAPKSENDVKPVSIDAPQFYRYWSA